jgi:DNA repair protein SbcD/Mre11
VVHARPSLRPEGDERFRLLLLHGEIAGIYPFDRSAALESGALIDLSELAAAEWSYVALGHYHVQHQVAPHAWYAGSLEYVSPNLWGELADETAHGRRGKGWLLADLETGAVSSQPIEPARAILDLPPLQGEGLAAAELDTRIAERLAAVPGGIADKILRLRVYNVPRHVARELDYAAIRAWKAEALHLHLDLRRPEIQRTVGIGAPGRRQTLPQLVRSYLERRPLPADLDRDEFVRLGGELMEAVDREALGG